jgi:hypothetical protein
MNVPSSLFLVRVRSWVDPITLAAAADDDDDDDDDD